MRDSDYDNVAPRYVAVQRTPVYVERNYIPQQRVVAVRHPAINDVSYVAVQRVPVVDDFFEARATRVVSVRNNGCGCSRADSYRTAVDDDVYVPPVQRVDYGDQVPYTSDVRHIVVKTDDIAGTEEVLYSSGSIYDDSAYVDPPEASVPAARSVAYDDMADVYLDDDAVMNGNAAYVADDDMDAACLPESVVYDSPSLMTRSVSYTPADEVNDYDVIGGTDVAYVADDDAAPPLRYESADRAFDDTQTVFISDDDIEADCPDDVSVNSYDTDVGTQTINYVPVENVDYVPVYDDDMDCSCETSVNTFDDGSIDGVDAFAANADYYADPVGYDESVDPVDAENDAYYDPYIDDQSAELGSDADFRYVE
jgi:hypothetical protein